MNTSDQSSQPDYSDTDTILEDIVALTLGELPRENAQRLRRELSEAVPHVQNAYNTMLLTTQLLPASLTMVEPPMMLKQHILSRIHEEASVATAATHHHEHEEFIPLHNLPNVDFYELAEDEGDWLPHPIKGIAVKTLATDKERGYATLLMRLDAGSVFPSHNHVGAEQCFIASGEVTVRGRNLGAGGFFSTQAHTDHGDIVTSKGATVLLVVAIEDYRKSAWKVGLKVVKQRLMRMFE
jgi:quercetin dioxygenase-like cupin family protein